MQLRDLQLDRFLEPGHSSKHEGNLCGQAKVGELGVGEVPIPGGVPQEAQKLLLGDGATLLHRLEETPVYATVKLGHSHFPDWTGAAAGDDPEMFDGRPGLAHTAAILNRVG